MILWTPRCSTGHVRMPLADNDGKSGAVIERAVLADGTRVIVKCFDPAQDIVMRLTGDARGREVELFTSGVLDRLPEGVGHSVLGGWYDDDGHGVLVMRDLGDLPMRWSDPVTPTLAAQLLRGVVALHREFAGAPPEQLTPLDHWSASSSPAG